MTGCMAEIVKCLSDKDAVVTEVVADFIRNGNDKFVLINVVRSAKVLRQSTKLPKCEPLRHLSLHLGNESLADRQQSGIVCCGDYCGVFKRDNLEMVEKLEYLINNEPGPTEVFKRLLAV